jgi:branched-chain amino acid transport system substrate-binding protein
VCVARASTPDQSISKEDQMKKTAILPLISAVILAGGLIVRADAFADIVIAHVTPLTGPPGIEGKEYDIGIQLAISGQNARGGIGGQQLVLRTEDDAYQPDKTIALIREVARKDTIALVMPIGSASMGAVLKEHVLEETGMPVVGMIPGAEPLRNPGNRYLYHVRAGDLDQYRKMVRNALTVGWNRMAVIYADIPFGHSGLAAITSILKEAGMAPALSVPVQVKAHNDFSATLKEIERAQANLVVLVLPTQIAGDFLRAYRAGGYRAPISTASYGNADALCAIATPEAAKGVMVTEVFPNIRDTTIPIVRRFQEDFKAYGPRNGSPNVLQLEGYVSMGVLIEALNRVRGTPNREKLVHALDSMAQADIGGFRVDFSPNRHTGSSYVDIGIIGDGCKMRF